MSMGGCGDGTTDFAFESTKRKQSRRNNLGNMALLINSDI
jgi:hypothetical protein